jgi:hypothetical protein
MKFLATTVGDEKATLLGHWTIFSFTLIVFLGTTLVYEIVGWYSPFVLAGQRVQMFDLLLLFTPFLVVKTLKERVIQTRLVKLFLGLMGLSIAINFFRSDTHLFANSFSELRLQGYNFSGVLLGFLILNLPTQQTKKIFWIFAVLFIIIFILRIIYPVDFMSDPQAYTGKFHDGRYASFVGVTTLYFLTLFLYFKQGEESLLISKACTIVAVLLTALLVLFSFQRTATIIAIGAALAAYLFCRNFTSKLLVVIFGSTVMAAIYGLGLLDAPIQAFLNAGHGGEVTFEFRRMVLASFNREFQAWNWSWQMLGRPFSYVYDLQLMDGRIFQYTLHNGFAGIQKAYGIPLSYLFVFGMSFAVLRLLLNWRKAPDKRDYAIALSCAAAVLISTGSYEYRDAIAVMIGVVLGQYNAAFGGAKPVE